MSSIVYSFHWVQRSLDEKKQRQSDSQKQIPTTPMANSTQLRNSSFPLLNQSFKLETNNNLQEYTHTINDNFEFLHSIM
ncbi:unnamed protein product [Rotaria sp. Silwood2]|nr:unnamed protein product [Rotaria sp. Silwood2]CAF2974206.1 unnamed protein product [Rotaria sp. Silwood2]CAF4464688.1 unnamed protein product [Rotaria sp. Silwood2]CAF4508951.1 unnamed protein product [Rotaria sp. Silwood2]